jgi:RNA polymerase sigma-70 factor (ECF subfamily)
LEQLVGSPDVSIEACRQGERGALDAFFRAELPSLTRLVGRLVGPSGDVDELVELTVVAAIRAFPRFRGEASPRRWLASIAVQILQRELRRPERRRRVAFELVPGEALVDRAPLPDRAADSRAQVRRLYALLDRLAPKKRIPFVLHVFEGRPVDEVAAIMNASIVATKSRIFWARRSLLASARKDRTLRELFEAEVVR